MTTPSDERMSDDRAREILLDAGGDDYEAPEWEQNLRAACDIGAAAIAERDELVEMLAELLRDDPSEEWIDHAGLIEKWRKATDLLVKHGRVIRDGSVYRWKTKGDRK